MLKDSLLVPAIRKSRSLLVMTLAVVAQTLTGCGAAEPTCTSFKYSAWGACQPDGGQTRKVTSSSPTGCVDGSPVLTRACSTTTDGAALYTKSCAGSGCHNALASSTLKGTNPTLDSFRVAHGDYGLTDAEVKAILTAIGP